MDYILYDAYDPGYDGFAGRMRSVRRIFVATCPKCQNRIWGHWVIKPWYFSCYIGGDYFDMGDSYNAAEKVKIIEKRCDDFVLKELAEIASYREEAKQFCEMSECPICGAKITKKAVRYWGRKTELWGIPRHSECTGVREDYEFDKIQSYFKEKVERKSERDGKAKHAKFLEKCLNADVTAQKYVIEDTEQLKQFLGHLISIEKNIYAVSKRLEELYKREGKNQEKAKDAKFSYKIEAKKKVDEAYANFRNAKGKDVSNDIQAPEYKGKWPERPIKPEEPSAPRLARAGLFNKRKVMVQNALLMEQYEEQKAQYEKSQKEYNEFLTEYNAKIERIEYEQESKRLAMVEQALNAHTKECNKLEKVYDAALATYKNIDKELLSTPEALCLSIEKAEIREAEELLKGLCKARKQMYAGGVIFEKYWDFVAISSFYEYISAGRCECLEGIHGAYNLYESEIRMDAIISQLAQVVENLQQIQKNQYVIYTAIMQTQNELKMLNKSTEKMNAALKSANEKLSNISKNTNIIAHNSAITAYYSKKNAELTDALGYLMAFS